MGEANYIRKLLIKIKSHIDMNTFNSRIAKHVTLSNISSKQKINKETRALNDTLGQMDLIDIYTEHSTLKQQNTHSSHVHMEPSPE